MYARQSLLQLAYTQPLSLLTLAKSQVSNRIKRPIVEPKQRIKPSVSLEASSSLFTFVLCLCAKLIPSIQQQLHLLAYEALERNDALGRKRMAYNLTLARMISAITRVEEPAHRGSRWYKGIVELGLERASAVAVHGIDGAVEVVSGASAQARTAATLMD